MSGTAAISAAKNRRSGNEVKFNGQSKSLPPPQDPRQQQQQQNGRQQPNGRQQQQQQQQQQQPQRMQVPHPMEILKSHEMRLRELEGSAEQPSETNTTTNTDDYTALQSDNAALKNSVSILEKKITVLLERTIYLEQIITGTKGRVEDFNTTVINLSSQLSNVESSVSEHSRFIAALGSESSRDNIQLRESDDRVDEQDNITLEIAPLN